MRLGFRISVSVGFRFACLVLRVGAGAGVAEEDFLRELSGMHVESILRFKSFPSPFTSASRAYASQNLQNRKLHS